MEGIKAETDTGEHGAIHILRETDGRFSVEMSNGVFPVGTQFDTAEAAVKAAVNRLNEHWYPNIRITSLASTQVPTDRLVKDEYLASLKEE